MPPDSLTTRFLDIVVFTARHFIRGTLKVTHSGLTGVLNDPTNSSLIIREVEMEKVSGPEGDWTPFKQLNITKNQIYCVCLGRKEDAGPRMMRAGYERSFEYDVSITDPNYAYQGTYQWPGRFDFSSMMSGGTGHFLPITEGVVYSLSNPEFSSASPVIVINKEHLATFSYTMKNGANKGVER